MRISRRGEVTVVEFLVVVAMAGVLIATAAGVYSAISGRKKVDERVQTTDNPDYQVRHLFTTDDGIKVYRFWDYGTGQGYVYFTSRNDVNWTTTESDGETTSTYHHQTLGQ